MFLDLDGGSVAFLGRPGSPWPLWLARQRAALHVWDGCGKGDAGVAYSRVSVG